MSRTGAGVSVTVSRYVVSITDLTSRITQVDLAWKAYPWRRHPGLPTFDISPGYFILVLIAFAVSATPLAYTLLTVVSISYVISWPTRQRYLQQSSTRISAAVSALCCAVAVCVALPLWPGPPPLRLDGVSDETMSQLVLFGRLAIAYGALLGLKRLAIAHFLSASKLAGRLSKNSLSPSWESLSLIFPRIALRSRSPHCLRGTSSSGWTVTTRPDGASWLPFELRSCWPGNDVRALPRQSHSYRRRYRISV